MYRSIFSWLIQLPLLITATTYTYTFQQHCNGYMVHDIGENDVVYLRHNGESLPGSYCSAGFVGRQSLDMYRICVYIEQFHFVDCGLQLDVSEETDYYKRSYSCGDEVPKGYCTGVEKTLHLVLKGINKGNNSVSIQVVAIKTYNHSRKIATIVGVSGAAIVLISSAVMVGVVIRRRRRHRPIKWVGKKKAFKLVETEKSEEKGEKPEVQNLNEKIKYYSEDERMKNNDGVVIL